MKLLLMGKLFHEKILMLNRITWHSCGDFPKSHNSFSRSLQSSLKIVRARDRANNVVIIHGDILALHLSIYKWRP